MTPVSKRSTRERQSDAEFLAQLERLGRDWRYSDEFIGIVVRNRFPRDYDDIHLTSGQQKTLDLAAKVSRGL